MSPSSEMHVYTCNSSSVQIFRSIFKLRTLEMLGPSPLCSPEGGNALNPSASIVNHGLPPAPTCALVANHDAQVYGGPLRLRRAAVGAGTVAGLGPDLLCHLAVGQGLVHRALHGAHPLFTQLLRLRNETAGRDKNTLLVSVVSASAGPVRGTTQTGVKP